MGFPRRLFLKLSAAFGAAGSACGTDLVLPGSEELTSDWDVEIDAQELIPYDAEKFPQGIMAGDATQTRAMVWTRYAGYSFRYLTVRVIQDKNGPWGEIAYDKEVTPVDGVVRHDVEGLQPGTRYWYVFIVRNILGMAVARSRYGKLRTAFGTDALNPISFGVTCCTHHKNRPFPTMIHAGNRRDLDCFFHLGDHSYNDGARTPEDFRAKYNLTWGSDGMRLMHKSAGLYLTWDDHEVGNDWSVDTVLQHKLNAAVDAFFEHRPVRRNSGERDRIYRKFRWGRTAEFFVLDVRSERDADRIISDEQLRWLISGLKASTSRFKFVMSPVPITNLPGNGAGWTGASMAQREELLAAASDVPGVWFIGGDVHFGASGFVSPPGNTYSQLREVICGPGGNGPWDAWTLCGAPQFDFATPEHNYTVFHCDPREGSVEVVFVNGQGDALFRKRYAS